MGITSAQSMAQKAQRNLANFWQSQMSTEGATQICSYKTLAISSGFVFKPACTYVTVSERANSCYRQNRTSNKI